MQEPVQCHKLLICECATPSPEWIEAQHAMDRLRGKDYRNRNSIAINAKTRAWLLLHPEWKQQYRDLHPEKEKIHAERRRAAIIGNTNPEDMLTEGDWQAKLQLYNHRCAYCGRKLGYGKGELHPTMDHVQPVSRNGQHVKGNIVPACKHCNSAKHAKTPEEWVGLSI